MRGSFLAIIVCMATVACGGSSCPASGPIPARGAPRFTCSEQELNECVQDRNRQTRARALAEHFDSRCPGAEELPLNEFPRAMYEQLVSVTDGRSYGEDATVTDGFYHATRRPLTGSTAPTAEIAYVRRHDFGCGVVAAYEPIRVRCNGGRIGIARLRITDGGTVTCRTQREPRQENPPCDPGTTTSVINLEVSDASEAVDLGDIQIPAVAIQQIEMD